MKSVKIVFVIAMLAFLMVAPQLSYAAINLKPPSAETYEAQKKAEYEVEKAGEQEKNIGSNQAISNTDATTRIASGETIGITNPELFENGLLKADVITLPADQITGLLVLDFVSFINNEGRGKYVVISGKDEKEILEVQKRLRDAGLILENYEDLIFSIAINPTIIIAVTALFDRANGVFINCTANNLSREVREDFGSGI